MPLVCNDLLKQCDAPKNNILFIGHKLAFGFGLNEIMKPKYMLHSHAV